MKPMIIRGKPTMKSEYFTITDNQVDKNYIL